MDIKIIEKLGSGWNGSIYLVQSGNAVYIYKIEKWEQNENEKQDKYFRQVEFDKFAQQYPDKFMILKSHGIINDCEHIQAIRDDMPKEIAKRTRKKNKLTQCYFMMYYQIYPFTFDKIKQKVLSDEKLWGDMMYQVVEQINILRTAGYYHNDIWDKNIMCEPYKNAYKYHIIDYGLISNKKWKLTKQDLELLKNDNDLTHFLENCAIRNSAYDFANEHKIKTPFTFNEVFNNIKKHSDHNKIASYVPKSLPIIVYKKCFMIVTYILYPSFYIKCFGPGFKDAPIYEMSNNYKNLILFIIQHSCDENYKAILNEIKRFNAGLI